MSFGSVEQPKDKISKQVRSRRVKKPPEASFIFLIIKVIAKEGFKKIEVKFASLYLLVSIKVWVV